MPKTKSMKTIQLFNNKLWEEQYIGTLFFPTIGNLKIQELKPLQKLKQK